MFGFGKKLRKKISTTNNYISNNQKLIAYNEGFVVYRGEDLLKLNIVQPLVIQLENAFGGDKETFKTHIYPSLKVLAAYCQFLPASEKQHHSEPLGLLVHSLQSAIVAMNYLRNCNVNFGVSPDKRDENTLAFKLACTLGALLHDVGKINDWDVATEVKEGLTKSKTVHYRFVRSIPEFISYVHKIDLQNIYTDTTEPSRDLYLPKYRILGPRKGRSKKHELMGNEKKHLFIATKTEDFISSANYELFEDLHFFTYEKLIDEKYINIKSLIGDIVTKADYESANFWKKNHNAGEVHNNFFDDKPEEFSFADEAPQITITTPAQNTDSSDVKVTVEQSAELLSNPDVSTTEKKEKNLDVQDNNQQNTQQLTKISQEHPQKNNVLEAHKNIISSDQKNYLQSLFSEIINKKIASLDNSIKINQNDDFSFIYTIGLTDKTNIKKLYVFIRFDELSKNFFKEILDEIYQMTDVDLFTSLNNSSEQIYLEKVQKILISCGIIEGDIFKIYPKCLWTYKKNEIDFINAVLLKNSKTAFNDESPLLVHIKELEDNTIIFSDYESLPFYDDLGKISQNKLKNAKLIRQYAINTQKDVSDETSSNEESNSNKIQSSSEIYEDGSVFGTSSFEDDIRSFQFSTKKEPTEQPKQNNDDLFAKTKKIIPVVNWFKADVEDDQKVSYLKSRQLAYYFSSNDLRKLKENTELLKQYKAELSKIIIDITFYKKLLKEIDLAVKNKSSFIGLSLIGTDDYYASFIWNTYNQKAKGGKGLNFLDSLISYKLVPLAVNNSRGDISDELEYFSSVMLSPLITKILVLSGVNRSIAVTIKDWTVVSKRNSAREIIRYFEHLLILCPKGQLVYGFEPKGSPLTELRIKEQALLNCELQLRGLGIASQKNKLLKLDVQKSPPYMWREDDELVLSFFRLQDIESSKEDQNKKNTAEADLD